MNKTVSQHKELLLYCVCGGLGVLTDYIVYYLLLETGLGYQYANFLGYLSGTLVSFFLNRVITFNVKNKTLQRLVKFVSVALLGYLSSSLLLWVLVEHIGLMPKIAKLITLPIVVILQYSLNKHFTFR